MKRPILVAIIGYIIGIIVGLYLQISVVPFYIAIIAIYEIYKNLYFFYILIDKRFFSMYSIKVEVRHFEKNV